MEGKVLQKTMTKTAFFANANGIFKECYPRFVLLVGHKTRNP